MSRPNIWSISARVEPVVDEFEPVEPAETDPSLQLADEEY